MNENQRKREELLKLARDYSARAASWLRLPLSADLDDNYESSSEYQTALTQYREFTEAADVEDKAYDVVLDYARDLYDRFDKTDKLLDEKADSVIKYLGGGSALATFGALASLKTDTVVGSYLGAVALGCLIPSLAAATRAVYFAILVRRPRSSATLPPVKWAVDMAHFHKTQQRVSRNIWLILQPLCEAYHYRTMTKAKLVHKAHVWYVWAIGLLLVPVVAVTGTYIACISLGLTKPPPAKTTDAGAVVSRVG